MEKQRPKSGLDARPGLSAFLKALQPGSTLVVRKLDRLGRDLRHLVTTVDDLRLRDVGSKVLTGAGAQIDATTAKGRLFFGVFAEFERKLIAERTRAGLAARARSRKEGRPRKMDRAVLKAAQTLLASTDGTALAIAKHFGIGTLYTELNRDGFLEEAGTKLMDAQVNAQAKV